MNEGTQENDTIKPKAAPIIEDKDFHDLIKSLVGQVVTVVNPESYEDAPVGHQIRAGFYRAKAIGLGRDYLILSTQFVHKGKAPEKEPVRQYIPLSQIRRISILKGEKLLHI